MNALGERIYEERKKKGWSQIDLAEKMSISGKAVSKWETGEAQPSLENITRLSELFGVSTDYLLNGQNGKATSTSPKSNFAYLEENKKTKHGLRVAGWICLGVGIILDCFGLLSFFQAFGTGEAPHLFFLLWIGGPLTFVGIVLLMFGYMGAVSRYTATQQAPVMKDTTNYVVQGTRDEVVQTIKDGVSTVQTSAPKGPLCPKCGTQNEAGAAFCDHCGAPLTKTCPHCGEKNDADAKYCRKCGTNL